MLIIVPGPNATIFASLGVRLAKYWHTFSCPLFFGTIRKKGGLLGESRARCEMAARHQGRSKYIRGGNVRNSMGFFPPSYVGTYPESARKYLPRRVFGKPEIKPRTPDLGPSLVRMHAHKIVNLE